MKVNQLPTFQEGYDSKEKALELQKNLPNLLDNISVAGHYFEQERFNSHYQTYTLNDISPIYVYILDQCIDFVKNCPDMQNTQNPLYNNTTLTSDQINESKKIVDALFDVNTRNSILIDPQITSTYLCPMTFQAARELCWAVKNYIDQSFKNHSKKHLETITWQTSQEVSNTLNHKQ